MVMNRMRKNVMHLKEFFSEQSKYVDDMNLGLAAGSFHVDDFERIRRQNALERW